MQAGAPLAAPAGPSATAAAPPSAAAGSGGAVGDLLSAAGAAAQGLGRVQSLLACPVRTPGCVSADEALGELKAYKLGKRKRSYNQVAVVMQHASEPGRELPVLYASEHSGGGLPVPSGPSPALQYQLRLAGGVTVRAALYLVYATPLGGDASPASTRKDGDAPAQAPSAPASAQQLHTWLGVSRAHCCRGCDADVPLLAGIVRLGRVAAPPAADDAHRSGRANRGTLAAAIGDDASLLTAGSPRVKDPRNLYVSIDEPAAHVAPGPGGTRRFRLLLAVWAHAAGADVAGPPGPLLGSALSQPICCVANNDVPGGAASLTLRVTLPATWPGWGSAPIARTPSTAALAGAVPLASELRRPLQAVNALLSPPPAGAAAATERPGAAAALGGAAAQWLTTPCASAGAGGSGAGAAGAGAASGVLQMPQPPGAAQQSIDALLFLGAAAAGAGSSQPAAAAPAPPAAEPAAASAQAAPASAAAPSAVAPGLAASGPQRPRRSSPADAPAAALAPIPAPVVTTPTAAQGAEALAELLAGPRAHALPPVRLFPPPGVALYVRKDHSLRTLCQRFFELYAQQTTAVSISAAAERLGVKTRRIYDVVNVLETLGVVQRQAKGTYRFCGWAELPLTLARWAHAASNGAAELAAFGAAAEEPVADDASAEAAPGADGAFAAIQAAARAAVAAAAAEPGADSTLAGLTQRFVCVLQASPGERISWDVVLTRLGATERASRRLYDVANVLCAIHLIEKPGCATYRWKGAEAVTAAFGNAAAAAPAEEAPAAEEAEEAEEQPLARVPAELKRPRAPRSRPAALTKRARTDEATPGDADEAPADDAAAPGAALVAADDEMEVEKVPPKKAAADTFMLIAPSAVLPAFTTPTTVLGANDALTSPVTMEAIPGCMFDAQAAAAV